uniref:D-aspartate oxidase-like n=1 Tax=Phallusia mammillata TaxID=59560 RepID=A0A6F9DAJ0_9ASCI|nr:D-aspartate oxidase-like [Phallusia mammillata]
MTILSNNGNKQYVEKKEKRNSTRKMIRTYYTSVVYLFLFLNDYLHYLCYVFTNPMVYFIKESLGIIYFKTYFNALTACNLFLLHNQTKCGITTTDPENYVVHTYMQTNFHKFFVCGAWQHKMFLCLKATG